MGMKSPQTATTSLGDYEIALQTLETQERMILIESTEEDHLKNFFFFDIRGDLLDRAVKVGILRGLIGSLCLVQSDIEAMGHAIQDEFKGLIDYDDTKAIDSFIILQIDSKKGISYCSESWLPPILPRDSLDDLLSGWNSMERRGLERGVIELRVEEACYLIPIMKNCDHREYSSSLNQMLDLIGHPSEESPLKLMEIASSALNKKMTNEGTFSFLPTACVKRLKRK
jgi:hypothetical protein